MKKRIMILWCLLLLVFVFVTQLVRAQVDTAWTARYDAAQELDAGRSIALDDSGNVYVIGTSYGGYTNYDYVTIKYYPNGDTAWVRRFNGFEYSSDQVHAIALDASGNVYVTGTGYDGDYATVKYDSNGNRLWVRAYNGPVNSNDGAYAIALDSSDNIYVTGHSPGVGSGEDYATVKYYPDGDAAWVRRYNGPGNHVDFAFAIAVDGSGNAYVTGTSAQNSIFPYNYDYATIKYYPNGDTAWVQRYSGPGNSFDTAYAIAVDGSSNIYVTGASAQIAAYPYNYDYATIKYYPNGDTAWVRRYNGPGNADDDALAIAVDGSGNVYVTGASATPTKYEYATVKYDSNGNQLWVQRYSGPGSYSNGGAYAIALDDSGNVYVTGTCRGYYADLDYVTIKYYSNGDTAWTARYDFGDHDDAAMDIAVGDSGNIYVTGQCYNLGSSLDIVTIKYRQLPARYAYLPGDVNMFAAAWPPAATGPDVTYLVNFFRGLPTSHSCLLDGFWASADANGDCNVIGSDVTKLVNVFRGLTAVSYCPDYPPAWLTPADLPAEMPSGWPNCE